MKNKIKYIILSIIILLIILYYNNYIFLEKYIKPYIFINNKEIFTNYHIISTAYVINLDKRTDRWEEIQDRFNNSSIHLERISAIENTKGHIGCGLSFLKIIQMAKDNNLSTVLIFEDDNKPMDNFDLRWKVAKIWLDNNLDKWEIINGGARFYDWENYNDSTESSIYEKQTEFVDRLEENVNFFKTEKLVGANWIYINSTVYDKVLAWSYKTHGAIDAYILNRNIFNVLFILPLLGMQVNSYSNTENRKQDFDKTDNKIIYIFDKILNNIKNI